MKDRAHLPRLLLLTSQAVFLTLAALFPAFLEAQNERITMRQGGQPINNCPIDRTPISQAKLAQQAR
jgi:hypothetical protein